jgi:hypothetical protein
MTARTRRVLGAFALTSVVVLAGCARGCTSSRPPIHINPSMDDQPKVRSQAAQAASDFFYNGASMREPVPGTVAIGGLKEDTAFFTGKGADGQFVATIPHAVDDALLERGRQRYGIYCQPCHDARGDGRGILFQQGTPTATFHDPKIVQYPDGQIFDVITNGQGLTCESSSASSRHAPRARPKASLRPLPQPPLRPLPGAPPPLPRARPRATPEVMG